MKLSKEQVKEFQEVYLDSVGEKLSEEEAREIGVNIARLIRDTYSFGS